MRQAACKLFSLATLTILLSSSLGLTHAFFLPVPQLAEQKVPAILKAQPLKPEAGDDELRKLLKEKYNAALREMRAWQKEWEGGGNLSTAMSTSDNMAEAANRALETELELTNRAADHIRIRTDQVLLAQGREKVIQHMFDAGRISAGYLERARYDRLEAEINLLKAKRKAVPERQK